MSTFHPQRNTKYTSAWEVRHGTHGPQGVCQAFAFELDKSGKAEG